MLRMINFIIYNNKKIVDVLFYTLSSIQRIKYDTFEYTYIADEFA